jgi:hypothetical protein
MPLRVALDLDGTLADMELVLRREAEALFGAEALSSSTGPEPEAAPDKDAPDSAKTMAALRLNARQQMQLWDHIRTIENFWTTLPEIEPGIVSRLAKTAEERRWEVIFLTTRPAVGGDTVQRQSQRWLEAHGFPLPSVFVVQRSRGKIADALELDAVVDDRPENCLDVAVDSQARPILIWPGDPRDVPGGAKRLGVQVVSTIGDALALLVRLDDLKNNSGVMRSLRKLFGK